MQKAVERWIVRYLTFPLINWLYNRRSVLSRLKALSRREKWSQQKLKKRQLKLLKKQLKYVQKYIPYYQELFRKIGFKVDQVKSLSDLQKIPPLTRQDVIDHHHRLVDKRYQGYLNELDQSGRGPAEPVFLAPFKRNKLIRNTSSGSTGYPTRFYEDGNVTGMNWSHEFRIKSWYGAKVCEREARLVRMATDYMPSDKVIHMRKKLWNQLLLPGVNLTDQDYQLIYDKLNQYQPAVFWGFTSALAGFCHYVKKKGLTLHFRPRVAITWAAPLYDHEKVIIEEVLQCPATNIYGTRELGHIAGYCPHEQLHINQDHYIVEELTHSKDAGELVVTQLFSTPMPFIRYKTGDLGRIAEGACGCGKTLETIDSFLGRTGEVFTTQTGRMISPNFWCRTFMDPKRANSFQRFQVIYQKDGVIRIKLVKNKNFKLTIEKDLKDYLKEHFTDQVRFDFEYVSEIKPMVSGKYQMVIKE